MTRRRATGKQRISGGRDRGDHLDQLLDDGARDTDVDEDIDADGDDAGSDRDQDDGDDLDDDQELAGRDDDQDDRGGRRRKRGRQRSQDDDVDVDDDRDRPITVEDLEKAAQRIADRQVNALLRRLDRGKSGGRDQQDRDDRGGRRRRDDRDRDRTDDSDRDTSRRDDEQRSYDQREARLAFRDYFGGDGRSLSTTERELANTLSRVEITTRLDEHGDPDRAGREAADRVGDQLAEFRRLVEKQTVAALRKRGALRERGSSRDDDEDTTDSGNAGGSQPPGRAPSPAKLADKRQAAKSFAADYNARLGHTPTTTDAGTKVG